jgi:hypothetical protein
VHGRDRAMKLDDNFGPWFESFVRQRLRINPRCAALVRRPGSAEGDHGPEAILLKNRTRRLGRVKASRRGNVMRWHQKNRRVLRRVHCAAASF